MPAVNPKILKWARETAGLSLKEAARAINLQDSREITAIEKLKAMEAGEKEPSRVQLERMSQKYRRSLLVFYLSEPPPKGDRGQDFRTLPGQAPFDSPHLDALIRDLKTRQNLVKSLLEDEEAEELPFIGSAHIEQGEQAVAESIISTLNFELTDFRARKSVAEAFAYLRQCIENSGIFVLLAGDLGTHHTTIPTEIFRGFAIADSIAPFVVVNDHDTPVAWSFTALHEVAHLWLGQTGISGTSMELEVERFCNAVAGRILLPAEELNELEEIRYAELEQAITQVSEFAKSRNISRAMVAFSLFHFGKIEQRGWKDLTDAFRDEWRESIEKKKKKKEGRQGGPNYYVVRRHRLGPALIDLVARSISGGTLSPTKAARILGVRLGNVEPLLDPVRHGRGL